MSRMLSSLLVSLVALVGPWARSATALQESPGTIDTGQGVVASVNGEAITSSDVIWQAKLQAGAAAVQVDDRTAHSVRREIAQQVLLASEADRLGIQISEPYIEDFWKRYHGELPEYEAMAEAAQSTVERQKELVRRSVLADLFLYHRVGIWVEFGHVIKPDPVLTHFVEVTPKELRELFQNERARFDVPETVSYEFYPCPDEASARAVRESLELGLQPNLRSANETIPVTAIREAFGFAPDLATFLEQAPAGAVSEAHDAQAGWVVFQVHERTPGRPAEFKDVQEELRRRLRLLRLDGARRKLIADLTQEAVYWPKDLFSLELEEQPGLSGAGAASTLRRPLEGPPAPPATEADGGSP